MTGIVFPIFVAAALAEITGCYCFWAWARLGRSIWFLPAGMASLIVFALLLTVPQSEASGRVYAIYGGIYVLTALAWMAGVDRIPPDAWDWAGALLILAGSLAIMFGRHSS